jgi:hypothetical protein
MSTEPAITVDLLAADIVFLLQCLQGSLREGGSTNVIDVRDTFGASVTLGFTEYLRFLKQYGYVSLSAEHVLSLLPTGRQVSSQGVSPSLLNQLQHFFAHKLSREHFSTQAEGEERAVMEAVEDRPASRSPGWMEPPRTSPPPARSKSAIVRPQAPSVSPYVLGDPIGRGPIGRVVRARHSVLRFDVAIKEIRETNLLGNGSDAALISSRLKRELSAQARIRHPSIVIIYDLDQASSPLVVQELCEGGNLRSRMTPESRLATTELLRAFVQLLDGLAVADEEGFTHGNIKAENVLFDRYGNAKLSDFGFSRLTGKLDDFGASGDVLAVGLLLYETLTGRVHSSTAPFVSKANPRVPAGVDWVVDRMTAEQPHERYRDSGEARDALLSALANPMYGKPGEIPVMTTLIAPEELAFETDT